MEIYRISKSKYANDITGEGARLYGGRWNRPGMAVLYTSETRSLALLELIVHFSSKSAFKENYCYLTFDIDERFIEILDINLLPKNGLEPNDNRLWKISDYYFNHKKVAALKVPSVLIPQENNIIINPNHFEFKALKVNNLENILLDERFKNSQ